MNPNEIGQIFDRANDSFERASENRQLVARSLNRADAVLRRADERGGAAREAARRERQRLNSGALRKAKQLGIAIGLISLATIGIGLVIPIGMFGFLAAVGLAVGIAALLLFSGDNRVEMPSVTADLPNEQMVQRFDSYLFRTRAALPAPAQAEIDQLSSSLPDLRQTLSRVDDMNPEAQDARRLMSKHLPGLIDRYLHVPQNYRAQRDAEDVSVDERLVEALAAGRQALREVSERLAKSDLAAFETQGRFIKSRYGDNGEPGA